jgi:hypothetical protein
MPNGGFVTPFDVQQKCLKEKIIANSSVAFIRTK